MILEMVLSCKELGLRRLERSIFTGLRGVTEEGAEEDKEMEGATVYVVLSDDVSGFSCHLCELSNGDLTQFLCDPVNPLPILFP